MEPLKNHWNQPEAKNKIKVLILKHAEQIIFGEQNSEMGALYFNEMDVKSEIKKLNRNKKV